MRIVMDVVKPFQTRIHEHVYMRIKAEAALSGHPVMREYLGLILSAFITETPYKVSGDGFFHIRQPDARRNPGIKMRSVMFWPDSPLYDQVLFLSKDLGVSISSIFYTAMLWWENKLSLNSGKTQ